MPHIVVTTDELPVSAIKLLATVGSVFVWEGSRPMPRETMIAELAAADALVCLVDNPLDDEVLESAPQLRIVANVGVGVNNIDLDAARARRVWVTNTPDVLTDATADLTMALLLAVARRIVEAEHTLRSGGFSGWGYRMLLGTELAGKTLGIVGFGRIGKAVGRRAEGFGMRVVGLTSKATPDDVDELFASSDFLSIHAPLTDSTKHLVDERRLALMKPTAILINTSRGPLVDENALADALIEGRLGGAGLDVFEREPEISPRILEAPNTVLVPHIGSATLEARTAMARLAAESVVSLLGGGRPVNVVVEGR